MTVLLGGLCLVAWYFGRFYHHPAMGLYIGMAIAGLIYGLTTERTSSVTSEAIMAFLVGVPLIYALVLLTQVPLLVLGLIPYSAHTYFVTSIAGALVGAGFCALGSLYATLKDAVDAIAHHEVGAIEERSFLMRVSFRAPLGFLAAVGFVLAGHKLGATAMLVLGTAAGMVAAAAQSIFTVMADHRSVREGWLLILVIEFLLALGLAGGLFEGIFNHSLVRPTMELVLSAAIACAVTYGLVYLTATLLRATPTRATRSFERRTSSQDDVSHQVTPGTEGSA
jgi:hypothetical protein